jgi:hypothetical protein
MKTNIFKNSRTKKIITLLIFFVSLSLYSISQKIDKQDLLFDYIKMPAEPLNKSIKNFSSNVILAYEADIIAKEKAAQDEFDKAKAEYPKKVAEAQDEYNKRVEKYKADKAEWDKKSTGDKIVEKTVLKENNKPVEPGTFYKPSEPYLREIQHQKVFDKNMLASTYLKLDGFNNSPDNSVKITATLFGFENLEPELKTKEESEYNSQTKATSKIITYWYEIQYKHPISLKITLPSGETIMDETLLQFSEYSKASTGTAKGSYPSYNKEAFLTQLQNKVIEDNMKVINGLINSKYGYQKAKRNSTIIRIEPKKFTYDDFQQAYESAVAGYGILTTDFKSATEKLNKSIELWEKALTEFNPNENKVRIDEDVAKAAHFNLAEGYIWTNNFSKADEHLSKIIGLEPSKKEERAVEELRNLLRDQKTRWEANNK